MSGPGPGHGEDGNVTTQRRPSAGGPSLIAELQSKLQLNVRRPSVEQARAAIAAAGSPIQSTTNGSAPPSPSPSPTPASPFSSPSSLLSSSSGISLSPSPVPARNFTKSPPPLPRAQTMSLPARDIRSLSVPNPAASPSPPTHHHHMSPQSGSSTPASESASPTRSISPLPPNSPSPIPPPVPSSFSFPLSLSLALPPHSAPHGPPSPSTKRTPPPIPPAYGNGRAVPPSHPEHSREPSVIIAPPARPLPPPLPRGASTDMSARTHHEPHHHGHHHSHSHIPAHPGPLTSRTPPPIASKIEQLQKAVLDSHPVAHMDDDVSRTRSGSVANVVANMEALARTHRGSGSVPHNNPYHGHSNHHQSPSISHPTPIHPSHSSPLPSLPSTSEQIEHESPDNKMMIKSHTELEQQQDHKEYTNAAADAAPAPAVPATTDAVDTTAQSSTDNTDSSSESHDTAAAAPAGESQPSTSTEPPHDIQAQTETQSQAQTESENEPATTAPSQSMDSSSDATTETALEAAATEAAITEPATAPTDSSSSSATQIPSTTSSVEEASECHHLSVITSPPPESESESTHMESTTLSSPSGAAAVAALTPTRSRHPSIMSDGSGYTPEFHEQEEEEGLDPALDEHHEQAPQAYTYAYTEHGDPLAAEIEQATEQPAVAATSETGAETASTDAITEDTTATATAAPTETTSNAEPTPEPVTATPAAETEHVETDDDKARKKYQMRKRVADEILATEQSYVESLSVLRDVYVEPLHELNATNPVLTKQQSATLFSNIQIIQATNETFLKDLAKNVQGWQETDVNTQCMGQLFINFAPYFKMYTQYVNNHDAATLLLKKLVKDTAFQSFVKKGMQNPKSRNMNLQSFLIMPIQRIPRYKLLLAELLKHTDPLHPDHSNLTRACSLVDDVARHINEAIRTQENHAIIMALQEKFTGNVQLVQPGRFLIRQGPLTKRGRRSDTKYQFFLFNDCLAYAGSVVGRYKLHQEIKIDGDFAIESMHDSASRNELNAFKIQSVQKSFIVYAKDNTTKQEWMKDIQMIIDKRQTSGATLRKQSSHMNIDTNVSDYSLSGASPSMRSIIPPSPTHSHSHPPLTPQQSTTSILSSQSPPPVPLHLSHSNDGTSNLGAASPSLTSSTSMTFSNTPTAPFRVLRRPVFVQYSRNSTCICCNKSCTQFSGRHHCRACGNIVCEACSKEKLTLDWTKKRSRVCDKCAEKIRESNDATLARLLPGSMSVDQATAAAGGSNTASPVATTPAETPAHSRTSSMIDDGTVLKPTKTHQKVVGLVLTELLTKKKSMDITAPSNRSGSSGSGSRARAHKGKNKKRSNHSNSTDSPSNRVPTTSTPTNASYTDDDGESDDDGKSTMGDDDDGGVSVGEHSEDDRSEYEEAYDRSVITTRHPSMNGDDYDREANLERERALQAQLQQDDALPPVTMSSTFYRVVFAFHAKHANELSVQAGDIAVLLSLCSSPEWLNVRVGDSHGLVPSTYLFEIPADDHEHFYQCLSGYKATSESEMNFDKNDLIQATTRDTSGWWFGMHTATRVKAWFPSNYTKPYARFKPFSRIQHVQSYQLHSTRQQLTSMLASSQTPRTRAKTLSTAGSLSASHTPISHSPVHSKKKSEGHKRQESLSRSVSSSSIIPNLHSPNNAAAQGQGRRSQSTKSTSERSPKKSGSASGSNSGSGVPSGSTSPGGRQATIPRHYAATTKAKETLFGSVKNRFGTLFGKKKRTNSTDQPAECSFEDLQQRMMSGLGSETATTTPAAPPLTCSSSTSSLPPPPPQQQQQSTSSTSQSTPSPHPHLSVNTDTEPSTSVISTVTTSSPQAASLTPNAKNKLKSKLDDMLRSGQLLGAPSKRLSQ